MPDDTSIFAVPFSPAEAIAPRRAQLDDFLGSPKKEGGRERHADDCAPYRQLLKEAADCAELIAEGHSLPDAGSRIRFTALDHTRFASAELLSVVEQYKFQMHALGAIDYRAPAEFIKSAEAEMSRLDAKNLKHALRLARLSEMVRERKTLLDAAKGRWSELATELRRMAIYLRENLVKVEKRAEAALAVLNGIDSAARERQLTEHARIYIKDRVKGSLRTGRLTQADLDAAKKEYDTLARALSGHVEEDTRALKTVFQTIGSHAKQVEIDIALHLADMDGKKSAKDKQECLKQIEFSLVELVRNVRLYPDLASPRADIAHIAYVNERRGAMLSSLLDELGTDRRLRNDRRRSQDRRKGPSLSYKGPERRTGSDRRSERARRR